MAGINVKNFESADEVHPDKSEIAVVDLGAVKAAVSRPSRDGSGRSATSWWAPTAARPTTSV